MFVGRLPSTRKNVMLPIQAITLEKEAPDRQSKWYNDTLPLEHAGVAYQAVKLLAGTTGYSRYSCRHCYV